MTESTLREWLGKLEAHAAGEAAHGERVAVYAVATADRLGDFDLRRVRVTAALHDVGKLALPAEMFQRDRDWTSADVRAIRTHVFLPEDLQDDELDRVAIEQHHERLDGIGYPEGLRGEHIGALARVISVCEAFDAMVHESRHRGAKSEAAAIEEIRRGAGTQFCPRVIEAFVAVQPLIQPLR